MNLIVTTLVALLAPLIHCRDPLHPSLDNEGTPLKKVITQCITKSGVDPQYVVDVIQGNYEGGKDLWKFMGCVYNTFGIITPDHVNGPRLLAVLVKVLHIPQKDAGKVVQDCLRTVKVTEDVDDTSINMDKCLRKHFKEDMIEFI